MGRRSKKDRPPSIIQGVVADNVKKLRDLKFADLPNETARNRKLAQDAGTTLSQIQRIILQTLSPGVDMIERLAAALDARPQDMLTPYFGTTVRQERERKGASPFTAADNAPTGKKTTGS